MQFPTASFPAAMFQRQPIQQPPARPSNTWQPASQQPVLAAQAPGKLPEQPKPKVRLQAPEPERPAPPARLVMPSPEELGIVVGKKAAPVAAEVDLNVAFARLRQLGAIGLQIDRLAEGGYRARFELPGRRAVEGTGPTEGTALVAALERAERQ